LDRDEDGRPAVQLRVAVVRALALQALHKALASRLVAGAPSCCVASGDVVAAVNGERTGGWIASSSVTGRTAPQTSEHGINVRRLEQALVGCGYFQDDDAETAAPSVAKLYDESRALDIRRLHFDQGIEETHERFEECGNPKCVWARRVLNESGGWRGMFPE
jgi:hypothetical protein